MVTNNVLFALVAGMAFLSLAATAFMFGNQPRYWLLCATQIVPLVLLHRHRERLPTEMFLAMLLLYMVIDRVATYSH